MYCLNPANIPVGRTGLLKIILQPDPHINIIIFRCEVVRIDESGAGIRFINIDITDITI